VEARSWRLRTAALLGVGAFAVHQLRFAVPYGRGASHALAVQGHAYLLPLAPVLVGVLLLAFAHLLGAVARGAPAPAVRFRRLWVGASASLAIVYSLQELIEGLVSRGHPGGLEGVVGHGGWLALPLSIVIGLAIALLSRGASVAAARARRAGRPWRAPAPLAPLVLAAPGASLSQLARAFPRVLPPRGPPVSV
jgi:hypothetical protein